jgi:hypothetical protein
MRDTHHNIRFARVLPCLDADCFTGVVVSIEIGMAGWRRTNRQCVPKGVGLSTQTFIVVDLSPALKQGRWCLAHFFTSAHMVLLRGDVTELRGA